MHLKVLLPWGQKVEGGIAGQLAFDLKENLDMDLLENNESHREVVRTSGLVCFCLLNSQDLRVLFYGYDIRLKSMKAIAAPSKAPPMAHPTAAPAIAPVETPDLLLAGALGLAA